MRLRSRGKFPCFFFFFQATDERLARGREVRLMGEAAGRLAGEAKEKLKRKSWLEKREIGARVRKKKEQRALQVARGFFEKGASPRKKERRYGFHSAGPLCFHTILLRFLGLLVCLPFIYPDV